MLIMGGSGRPAHARARATAAGSPGSAASRSGSNSSAPSTPVPPRTSATSGWSPSERRAACSVVSNDSARLSRPSSARTSRLARAAAQTVGMPGVGGAVPECGCARLPERSGHAFVDDDPAQRQVPARHALGENDEIGDDAETVDAEPVAEPAETADHAVDHEQHAVAACRYRGSARYSPEAGEARHPRRSPAPRRTRPPAPARSARSPSRARRGRRRRRGRRPARTARRAGWPACRRATCRSRGCRGRRTRG